MRKIITLIILLVMTTQVYSHEYQVLNQGNTNTCLSHAINTYIDYIGEPTDVNPYEVFRNCKGYLKETMDYCIMETEVSGYEQITEAEYPCLAIVYFNRAYWKDGDITQRGDQYHAIVLIGEEEDYLIGINSYGSHWGFDGLCHISKDLIYRMYRLEFEVYK